MSGLASTLKFNLLKFFINNVDLRLAIGVVIVSLELVYIFVTIVGYRFIGKLFINLDLKLGGVRREIILQLMLLPIVLDLLIYTKPCIFVSNVVKQQLLNFSVPRPKPARL